VDVVITVVVIVGLAWPVFTGMVGDIRLGADRNVNSLVNEYWDGMIHRIENAVRLEDDSSLQRVRLWEDTLRLIFDRPFLGVGLGNFEFAVPRFMSRESLEVKLRREDAVGQELMAFSAHNEYLEVWAETGLIGVVAFGILLLQIGRSLLDLIRRYIRGDVSFLAVGFAGSILATLVHAFFSTNLQQPASAVHFWLVVGLVWALKLNVDWMTPLQLLATKARKVAIGMMVLCGVVLVILVVMATRTIIGEVYYRRGEQAFRQEAYDVAQLQWQTATGYSPTRYYRTYQALGTAFYNEKKWDDAIGAFRQSLVYFPNNARVHYLLGRALVQAGNHAEAVVHSQHAVKLNPLVADFQVGLGEGLYSQQPDKAIEVLSEALVLQPNHTEAHRLLGASHKKTGNLDAAVLSYQQVLKLSSDDVDVLNSLAVVYSEQGNQKLARDFLQRVVAQAPGRTDYRFNLAVIQVELKDYAAALETLAQVIKRAPNFARAYAVLGQVFADLGNEKKAQQAFGHALKLAPNDLQIRQMLDAIGVRAQ